MGWAVGGGKVPEVFFHHEERREKREERREKREERRENFWLQVM